jgi:hypothetical protein
VSFRLVQRLDAEMQVGIGHVSLRVFWIFFNRYNPVPPSEASGRASGCRPLVQVGRVLSYDHWVPRAYGPPVSDIKAEMSGVKKNTVAHRKKNRSRMNGRDAPRKAIRWPRVPNRRGGELSMHELYL